MPSDVLSVGSGITAELDTLTGMVDVFTTSDMDWLVTQVGWVFIGSSGWRSGSRLGMVAVYDVIVGHADQRSTERCREDPAAEVFIHSFFIISGRWEQ